MRWLSLLALALAQSAQSTPSDDESVMKAFGNRFTPKRDDTTSVEQLLALYPKWVTNERVDFDECLAAEIEAAKKVPKEPDLAKQLEEIKGQIGNGQPPYAPTPLMPLSSMTFPPTIILEADLFKTTWHRGRFTAKNREGKELPVGLIMRVKPPGYSKDGQFACLETWFPMGHHMSRDRYFLRKESGCWTILVVPRTNFI